MWENIYRLLICERTYIVFWYVREHISSFDMWENIYCLLICERTYIVFWYVREHISSFDRYVKATKPYGRPKSFSSGWRTIRCLNFQVTSRKSATNYRALLRKMTNGDKASYGSSPPCMCEALTCARLVKFKLCFRLVFRLAFTPSSRTLPPRLAHYPLISHTIMS